jgi:hypothetical protein
MYGVTYALASGVAVTLSATGIGLLVAGATITFATTALCAMSAYKTHQHVKELRTTYDQVYHPPLCNCRPLPGYMEAPSDGLSPHDYIHREHLPYIINKKEFKYIRKVGTATIVGAPIESFRAAAQGSKEDIPNEGST